MSERHSSVEYRPIPEFEGYEVGSDGSVWTLWKTVGLGYGRGTIKVLTTNPRCMKQTKSSCGYLQVGLYRNGKALRLRVHVLVLDAFVGPKPFAESPRKYHACHNNGIKTDNRLCNLRWDTAKANSQDRERHGTAMAGELHPRAKITEDDVRQIREMLSRGETIKEVSTSLGVGFWIIADISKGKSWRHIK